MNPRLRFKKADGTDYPDWEEKNLGELTYKTGVKNKNNFDLETYSINNIDGFVPQKEQFENAGYLKNADRSIYYIVSHGSFAYNPARINVGSIGFQNLGKDVLVSSLYEIFNTKDELNDKFLMNYFKTINFKNNVKKYSEGGVRSYFYYDKLCSLNVFIPCLEEQEKIADFLSDIDEVILASEQEVKKLQELKKGAMQKIFSQEVRFKRDDGTYYPDWEEKKFNDVFEFLNNNTFSRDMLTYENAIVKNIHYGDILIKFGNICDIECDNLPFIKPEFETSRYNLLKNGDIIIADTAEDDTVGKAIEIYNLNNNKVISGLHTMACRPIMFFSPKYLGYYINSFLFHEQLKPYMQGIKVTSVNRKNIVNTMIKYPFSLEEQQKIGDFLSDFDEAISLVKQELEKWKLLKKGLLQQMFT